MASTDTDRTTPASEGLKPCPFCGGGAEMNGGRLGLWWVVFCVACGSSSAPFHSRSNAIAAWNRRTQEGK